MGEIEGLLADQSGKAAFARRFARMDEEEHHAAVYGDACLSRTALRGLVNDLLHSQQLWDGAWPLEVVVSSWDRIGLYAADGGGYEDAVIHAELNKNIELLWKLFQPPPAVKLEAARRLCVANWIK